MLTVRIAERDRDGLNSELDAVLEYDTMGYAAPALTYKPAAPARAVGSPGPAMTYAAPSMTLTAPTRMYEQGQQG